MIDDFLKKILAAESGRGKRTRSSVGGSDANEDKEKKNKK
jgi:hypothetical protein